MNTLQDLLDFVKDTNAFLQVFGTDQMHQCSWDVRVAKLRKTLMEELGTRRKIWHLSRNTQLPPKSKKECQELVEWCGEELTEYRSRL